MYSLWCSKNVLHRVARQTHHVFSSPLTAAFVALVLTGIPMRAQAQGELSLKPSTLNFGSVWLGRTQSIRVTITDSGNAAVKISGDTITGNAYGVHRLELPKTLGARDSAAFEISFSPTSAGTVTGSLELISNAANSPLIVPLSGEGVTGEAAPYASVAPLTAQFGDVPVGTLNTQSIEVKNTGARSLSLMNVTAKGSGFSVSGISTPVALAAGQSTHFSVGFMPKSAGSYNGSVNVSSTASDSQLTIVASGTGVGISGDLEVSPSSIAFGNVNVNGSATQQVVLKNGGNSSISVTGANISVSGANAVGSGLTVAGLSGSITLASNQTATLTVTFGPTTAGSISGTITITSTAANVSVTVPVTGTGVASTHAANLQWQASNSVGVIGYDIYRSTVSGGSYTKITSSPISGTSYSDTNVTAGVQYFYAVTAINADGTQSGYSNQVATTIP
jgi:Abnormal spindle-like microcephaly-assoc'd, ASPM-SPD-2-Hydin